MIQSTLSTPFLSTEHDSDKREIVIINGKGEGTKKTLIDGDSVVQLRRARQEESGFTWNGRKISKVDISDVLIYDEMDLQCLAWFIQMKIKVDLSKSFVSPDALDGLNRVCNNLSRLGYKVVEGSSICLPQLNGYSGIGRTDAAKMKCEEIGFKVLVF